MDLAAVTNLELWCPLPRMVNPKLEEVVAHSREWLAASGMVADPAQLARLWRAETGGLAAWTYPAIDYPMLVLISDWLTWLFALDDGYCDGAGFGRQPRLMVDMVVALSAVLDPQVPPLPAGGRCAGPLREIRTRIAAHATPTQVRRWETAVREYLNALVWEASNRQAGIVPSLPDYLFVRQFSGGTLSAFALIDVLARTELTAAEADDPVLTRFSTVASNLISWDNDIFSYAKERDAGDAVHNIITVLAVHHRCAPGDALSQAVELRNTAMAEVLELRATLTAGTSAAVRRYVEGVCSWIRGHIDWTLGSSRFQPARQEALL
jgi:hypothetical protein